MISQCVCFQHLKHFSCCPEQTFENFPAHGQNLDQINIYFLVFYKFAIILLDLDCFQKMKLGFVYYLALTMVALLTLGQMGCPVANKLYCFVPKLD